MQADSKSKVGRKKGSNIYNESTKVLRVPESMVEPFKNYLNEYANNLKIDKKMISVPSVSAKPLLTPLYSHKISAGFPSPADDHIEQTLDLNQHLITHPVSTFFLKVYGDSMIGAHIQENDILVVDKSLPPKNDDIVIAVFHAELTVKKLIIKKNGDIFLKPENDKYPIIHIPSPDELIIWGVVTSVIHQFKSI
jgi:DNA polymerase V